MARQLILKDLDINVKESASKGHKHSPAIIELKSCEITELSDLKRKIEKLQARASLLEAHIKDVGVDKIVALNCSTYEGSLSSVKMVDAGQEMVLVSFTQKYSDIDLDSLANVINTINEVRRTEPRSKTQGRRKPVAVDKFVQFVAEMQVNDQALYDEKGNFKSDIYARIRGVLDALTDVLVKSGALVEGERLYTESKKIRVKRSFHGTRWKAFTPKENILLTHAIQNAISLRHVAD